MKAHKEQKSTKAKGKTRENIIDIASRLFSEYTYLGVSMSDIAKKLNITKAALYYHFKNKEEIYEKVLDKIFSELKSFITEALRESTIEKKLRKLVNNYLNFGLREKNLIRALMLKFLPNSPLNKHIIKLREQIVCVIQPLINEMILHKKITKESNGHLITSLLMGMMDGILIEYSFLSKKIDSEKISNQIVALLLQS